MIVLVMGLLDMHYDSEMGGNRPDLAEPIGARAWVEAQLEARRGQSPVVFTLDWSGAGQWARAWAKAAGRPEQSFTLDGWICDESGRRLAQWTTLEPRTKYCPGWYAWWLRLLRAMVARAKREVRWHEVVVLAAYGDGSQDERTEYLVARAKAAGLDVVEMTFTAAADAAPGVG